MKVQVCDARKEEQKEKAGLQKDITTGTKSP
jgi:hypothetical protein